MLRPVLAAEATKLWQQQAVAMGLPLGVWPASSWLVALCDRPACKPKPPHGVWLAVPWLRRASLQCPGCAVGQG